MDVLKFGGTSVADADSIRRVISIVKNKPGAGKKTIVVSALSGITNLLLKSAALAERGDESYKEALHEIEKRHLEVVRQLLPMQQQSGLLSLVKLYCNEIEDICNGICLLNELSFRTKDKIAGYGELLSSQIIAAAFNAEDVDAEWKDARELIVTDDHYGKAAVHFEMTDTAIHNYFSGSSSSLFVIPGFIAVDSNGIPTTLGRGGSDYTAAIFAAALNARQLEIWTDVSGIMTADPRLVKNVKQIPTASYGEAMELSHFGAKVIYPPTIQPVLNKQIPVLIKNTFAPQEEGTLIKDGVTSNKEVVKGISSINDIALLSLEGSGMIGVPGFSKRLFETLANASINVILITQASSEHSICVGIEEGFVQKAKKAVDVAFAYEIENSNILPLIIEKNLSIIAVVGDTMKNHTGISGKMFSALGRNGINVRAIAQGASERNISAVINRADVKKAINVLHEDFFETTYKQLHLFLAGTGNVGKKFIQQLKQQQSFLEKHLRLQIQVVGIANSRKMLISDEGIDLNNWVNELEKGEKMELSDYTSIIKEKNFSNAVFVDITASPDVPAIYEELLRKSISIVACNKTGASSKYSHYKKLKELANEFNCSFFFETNVGAALPVIRTLNNLLHSGDKINRIEAVLSGTLNFVFNNYNGEKNFASIVRQAQQEGYTEPDPRLDLSGLDVMRKIMILAREAGEELEMEDIMNDSFIPSSCMNGSIEGFYKALEKEENHFKTLYETAKSKGKKLKFVAVYQSQPGEAKASVGLKEVGLSSDFYHLYGKDNAVLFYTDRYAEQPLVIKGAGAGADVTASGVFADIILTAGI